MMFTATSGTAVVLLILFFSPLLRNKAIVLWVALEGKAHGRSGYQVLRFLWKSSLPSDRSEFIETGQIAWSASDFDTEKASC